MPKQKKSGFDWTPHKAEIKDHYLGGKDHISITSHGTWKAARRGVQALSKYLAESGEELEDLEVNRILLKFL